MCLYCTPEYLVLILVLYIKVYIADMIWCKYEPNQNTDYDVNPGFIMSKAHAIKAVLTQCLIMAS